LISGIYGGAAYEVVLGKENLGRDYWAAFNYGLILFLVVIIVAGGINLVQYYFRRTKTIDKEVA
jgi:hypothetical protein